MDVTGSGSSPQSGVLDIRGVDPTASFEELIKEIILRKSFVKNETEWNWLRIVFIGELSFLG
jgi:hypothetical protein